MHKYSWLNSEGNIIGETEKSGQTNLQKYADIQFALKGEQGYFLGEMNGKRTLSVFIPLETGGRDLGVIRFTTSMEQFHEIFMRNTALILSIGGVVILFAFVLSFFPCPYDNPSRQFYDKSSPTNGNRRLFHTNS